MKISLLSPKRLIQKAGQLIQKFKGYPVATYTKFNEHANFYAIKPVPVVPGESTKEDVAEFKISFASSLERGPLELRMGARWKGTKHSAVLCLMEKMEQDDERIVVVMRADGEYVTLLKRDTSLEVLPRNEGIRFVQPRFRENSVVSQRVLIFPASGGGSDKDSLLFHDTSSHRTTFLPFQIPPAVIKKLAERNIKVLCPDDSKLQSVV